MRYQLGQKVKLNCDYPRTERGSIGVVINYWIDISGTKVTAKFASGLMITQNKEDAEFWPTEMHDMRYSKPGDQVQFAS